MRFANQQTKSGRLAKSHILYMFILLFTVLNYVFISYPAWCRSLQPSIHGIYQHNWSYLELAYN